MLSRKDWQQIISSNRVQNGFNVVLVSEVLKYWRSGTQNVLLLSIPVTQNRFFFCAHSFENICKICLIHLIWTFTCTCFAIFLATGFKMVLMFYFFQRSCNISEGLEILEVWIVRLCYFFQFLSCKTVCCCAHSCENICKKE